MQVFFPVRTRAQTDRVPLQRGLQRKKKRRALPRVRSLALLHNRHLPTLLRLGERGLQAPAVRGFPDGPAVHDDAGPQAHPAQLPAAFA